MSLFIKSLAVSLCLVITACAKEQTELTSQDIQSTWRLVAVDEQPLTLTAQQKVPTLEIDSEMNATGYSGCNQFSAQVVLDNNRIKLNQMVSTKKLCLKSQQNQLERTISSVFNDWSQASVENDSLVLSNPEHQLRFSR